MIYRLSMLLSRLLIVLGAVWAGSAAQAQLPSQDFADPFTKEPQFLPVDEAFQFDFTQRDGQLQISFTIEPEYYLYQHQFKVTSKDARLGELTLPPGKDKYDEFFGQTQVYYDTVSFSVPIEQAQADDKVALRFQGCADAGFCYPPQTKLIYLNPVSGNGGPAAGDESATRTDLAANSIRQPTPGTQFSLADQLADPDNRAWAMGLFLLLGVGLAFTPCVFPMYPILSGIIIGQGQRATWQRSFILSLVYVQGMAITYSLLGLVVASAGVRFQAMLQHPLILGVFIALFAVLALAMFGVYNLQLPASWQTRLNQLSQHQRGGNLLGVFVMGALSGLIASPCTTAPLTGILLFIAQSGDQLLGFISLYVLSLGMGIPLIAFGLTGGRLLPKAGQWMDVIKVTFGFMLLSVAIVFVERLWVSAYSNLLWAALGLAAFSYYSVLNSASHASFAKGARTLLIFVGLFGSAMLGWRTLVPDSASPAHPPFVQVESVEELQQQIAQASAQDQSVMVDLYADWCIACKEFEKYTFVDPQVINALSNTRWVQIDLTDYDNAQSQAFTQYYKVDGLPTILFFDEQGNELPQARVAGFLSGEAFARHVREHLGEAEQ